MYSNSSNDVMYYVAYGRVSTDEQRKGESVESQLLRIRRWADNQQDFVFVAEFLEDESGYKSSRPELDIIKELARQGRINAIVVTKRDRFARDEGVAILLEKEFADLGIRLYSLQEGEFSRGAKNRILSAVERSQSEDFAETAKKNMRDMRYHYIENAGAFPSQGKAKFGYDKTGRKAQSQLVINEDEADIVRWIFELFIARKTYNEIADILNRAGIPRPSIAKGLNRPSKIEGWNRLGVRNLIDDARYYKGEYVAYKRANRKEDHEGKEIIIHVPAIIDEGTYQKVQFIRDTLRRFPIYTEYDPFTLTKRLSCECGYAYSQQKTKRTQYLYRYYRCNSTDERYNRQSAHCTIRSLAADKIEAVVWDFIKSLLLDPRTAIARYKQQRKQNQAIIDNALTHLETIDELTAELNAEREQTLKLFKRRHITEDRLDADLAVIDRQLEKLGKEHERWTAIVEQYNIDYKQLDNLEKIAADLRDKLESVDVHTIIKIYDKLKLRVQAVTENNQIVVYLSILGYDAGKAVFSDRDVTACNYSTFTKALIFRVPIT